jgi:hypothetical protein
MGRHAARRKNSVLADGPLMRKRKGKVEKREENNLFKSFLNLQLVQIFFYGEKEDFIAPSSLKRKRPNRVQSLFYKLVKQKKTIDQAINQILTTTLSARPKHSFLNHPQRT